MIRVSSFNLFNLYSFNFYLIKGDKIRESDFENLRIFKQEWKNE
jgi:hypothetical protein